jgi:hypothetical protein
MSEAYRPQRTPINPSEIGGVEFSGAVPPELLQEIQQKASLSANSINESYQEGTNVSNQYVDAVQFQQPIPMPNKKTMPISKNKKDQRFAGPVSSSSKLQELVAGLKKENHIFEEILLPSKGKFYDGTNGPRDGKIHIRPMLGQDQNILATQRFVKKGTALNMIFDNCIQESKQFSSEKLLLEDRNFILIYLRGISYGPDYEVTLTCPFTSKTFNYTIDLNLDIDLCPDEFDESSLYGTLPSCGFHFKYHLENGEDEQKIVEYKERKSQFTTSQQTDDTLLYRTALLIDDIEGLTDTREILVLLKELKSIDVNYLRNLVTNPPFGVQTKIKVTSPFNGEEFEVELPLGANFFFPSQKAEMNA